MSPGAFVLRRILVAIPTLFLIMLATFALLRGTGGDPFTLPEGFAALPPPVERELRPYYRFDEPWPVQFAQYARNIVTFGFGPSLNRRRVSVDAVIEQSLPVTAQLVALASLVAIPIGFVLGLGALRRRTPTDTG